MSTNKGVWNGFETWVFVQGGLAAVCGLLVAYGQQLADFPLWGPKWGPVVTVVVGAAVALAKLYLGNNTKVPPPKTVSENRP